MAITDLTNTTWKFNDTLNIPLGYGTFSITTIEKAMGKPVINIAIGYDDGEYHVMGKWVQKAAAFLYGGPYTKTILPGDSITITGGTDVTNAQLISWLQENGTLVSKLKNALDRLAAAIKDNIGGKAVYPFTIEEMCNIADGTMPVANEGEKGKEGFFYYMEKMADCIAQRCDVELPLTIEEMIEALGKTSSVNITLDCAFGGYSNNSTVRVKFGSAPTDSYD